MAKDIEAMKKAFLYEWSMSTKSGRNKVNCAAFARKHNMSRTTINKYKDEWVSELEANVERLKAPDLPIEQNLNPNIKTMDNLRMMAALEGKDIDPADKHLWAKLGVDEYANRLAKVFTAVSKGSPLERAMRFGGIGKKDFEQLKKRVPIIQDLYEEAIARFEIAALDKMWKLSDKDHKSAAFLLERHEALREYYKPSEEKQKVEIKISIDRSGAPTIDANAVEEAEIIE